MIFKILIDKEILLYFLKIKLNENRIRKTRYNKISVVIRIVKPKPQEGNFKKGIKLIIRKIPKVK